MDHKLLGRFQPVWLVRERGTGTSSGVRSYRNLTFAAGPVNDGFVPDPVTKADWDQCPLSGDREASRNDRDWGAKSSGSFARSVLQLLGRKWNGCFHIRDTANPTQLAQVIWKRASHASEHRFRQVAAALRA